MASDWQQLIDKASYVEVDGTDVHHFDVGSGKPLVLVHGGGLSSSAELNWGAVIERFAEQFRVIALDLPGFGHTDPRGPRDIQPRERAAFLVEFLETLGVEEASLVGNSEGATIVSHVALGTPEIVETVALVNGGLTVREYGEPTPRTTVTEPTLAEVREEARQFQSEYFTETKYHPFWRELTDEKVRRLYEIEDRNWEFNNRRDEALRSSATAYNEALAFEGKPVPRQAERFSMPVLLPWSSVPYYSIGYYDDPNLDREGTDPTAPLDAAYEFYKRLDEGQIHVWHDSKHHVQTDRAPGFVDVVTSFVADED
jgi:pimeloyl-ACP methyl ester carboxylesterase